MVSATEALGNLVTSLTGGLGISPQPLKWERDTLIRISHSRYHNSEEKMLNS